MSGFKGMQLLKAFSLYWNLAPLDPFRNHKNYEVYMSSVYIVWSIIPTLSIAYEIILGQPNKDMLEATFFQDLISELNILFYFVIEVPTLKCSLMNWTYVYTHVNHHPGQDIKYSH